MSSHQYPVLQLPIIEEEGFIAERVTTSSLYEQEFKDNKFIILWVHQGHGEIFIDGAPFTFENNQIYFLYPYQSFRLKMNEEIEATVLRFHAGFFCIHKNHQDVPCNGLLFNVVFGKPVVRLTTAETTQLDFTLRGILDELKEESTGQFTVIVSYLKSFLLLAMCAKEKENAEVAAQGIEPASQSVLQKLTEAVDAHFRRLHFPADYAELLNLPLKTLAKVSKQYFGKTLTQLITEKIIIEAKTTLYLCDKSVKEVAHSLGYKDDLYFNRFFRKMTGIAPGDYKKKVGPHLMKTLAEGLTMSR